MNVFVIQGSPRMEKGYTQKILEPFIKGMLEAGANVETVYVQRQKITPCIADESCWYKTPGICIHKDDMMDNLIKLKESSLWVFVSPVYFSSLTGQLKIFIDRMLPLITPENVIIYGRTGHVEGSFTGNGKVVLLSTCGLYEMDNFEDIITYFKAFCKNTHREFVGSVLRPHPSAVEALPEDILESSYKAGYQLIKQTKLLKNILDVISRPLISLEEFINRQ